MKSIHVPPKKNSIIDSITGVHGDSGEEVVVEAVRAHGGSDKSGTTEKNHKKQAIKKQEVPSLQTSIIDPIAGVHEDSGEKVVVEVAKARESLGESDRMTCSPCGCLMPLTRKMNGKTLGAVGECPAKWVLLSMAVDSGACDNVIDAEEVPAYTVTQTKDSMSGDAFLSATGEEIPNLGELKIPMLTREDTMRHMTFCAAAVSKPLASVRKMVTAGHRVVFDDVSYIENKTTGEINYLREESGNYILDVWAPPPSSVNGTIGNMGFAWPSTP